MSAFSTWEKELPKFVFDDRFHLLLPKERKTAFDEFILTRTEEEMKEKKQKLKERKELFQSLLKEAKITKKYIHIGLVACIIILFTVYWSSHCLYYFCYFYV